MEAPSQLERFLGEQRVEGEVVNEGSFTISREKALNKLASFNLPFHGAWAVKIVQAAVHAGKNAPIRIDLTRKETRFFFSPDESWTLDELETSFFDPEPGPNQGINHLMAALWTVGIGEKRGFLLFLPFQSEALIWDGESFHRQPTEKTYDTAHISVSHHAKGSGWFSSSQSNAHVTKALSDYCYSCPVPLHADGRRIDGLHLSRLHGWGAESFPLALTFPQVDLPQLQLPPGTFDRDLAKDMEDTDGGGLVDVAKAAMAEAPILMRSPMAMMVTAHARLVKKGQAEEFQTANAMSQVYWVQDGVVVDKEVFNLQALPCSVGVYLNAEGLSNDISGFFLTRGPERDRRKTVATRAVYEELNNLCSDHLEEIIGNAERRSKKVGIGFIVAGVGMAFVSPFHGAFAIAAGAMAYAQGGKRKREWADQYYSALNKLRENWSRLV